MLDLNRGILWSSHIVFFIFISSFSIHGSFETLFEFEKIIDYIFLLSECLLFYYIFFYNHVISLIIIIILYEVSHLKPQQFIRSSFQTLTWAIIALVLAEKPWPFLKIAFECH